ncbi:MAG: T9SS type A sorting domain-containing protein [Candidatus Krumholzibacteriia bacterium]
MPARTTIGLAALALALLATGAARPEECTIGVASGRATADGRPLLWKVRDNAGVPDNEVYRNTALTLPFIAVVSADGGPDSPAWMGANLRGFALVNANVDDLGAPASLANGEFMRLALGTCPSVREFLTLLEATDGLRDTHANFGVIDTTGAALIVEASRDEFWIYDADASAPGFLIRTNFACVDTAGAGIDGLAGEERFVRSTDLVEAWVGAGGLDLAQVVGRHARDFSDWACRPFPLPCYECGEPDSLYGWFDTYFSICGGGTVSAAAIQGVAPPPAQEPAWLTTLWVHLGNPACTLALPYWPAAPVPAVADGPGTAPLCDLANAIREGVVFHRPYYPRFVDSFALDDGQGGGLWSVLRPAEATVLAAARTRLAGWRLAVPTVAAVLAFEDSLATAAHALLVLDVVTDMPAAPAGRPLTAYPNPFNPACTLAFDLAAAGRVQLTVHDLAGRRVARLLDEARPAGPQQVAWHPDRLASGVYVARLAAPGVVAHRRLVLVR